MLNRITPIVLTLNEAPNIGRTLGRLCWANEIIVVDSFSTDATLDIVKRYPQARIFQREFDSHQNQWNFALLETGIKTEWILALDADYLLTPELFEELENLTPLPQVAGYRARFVYCINGRPIRGSAYPPAIVLYRRSASFYLQDGHTQRIVVSGVTENLRFPIFHDDRKSLEHWFRSQQRYMKLEARKLMSMDWKVLSWPDRLRKLRIIAPLSMPVYCLFLKGAVLDGSAGITYALQRTLSELLLSLFLMEYKMINEGQAAAVRLPAPKQKKESVQGDRIQ